MTEKKLKMTYDPSIIQHLGFKMYTQVPSALAELIANAYDADAKEVKISLYNGQEKKIVVEDNGHGMSFDEINDKFLKIGRNRREDETKKTPGGRYPSGKKGLGKLAVFGIGKKIVITTKKSADAKALQFILDWEKIKEIKNGDYEPESKEIEFDKKEGTSIEISNIGRKTDFNQDNIKNSLARLFHYWDDFKVEISEDDKLPLNFTRDSKFDNLIIEYKRNIDEEIEIEFLYPTLPWVKGKIVTTEKPLPAKLRGVSLFARGRMVQEPGFFGISESSYFCSYVTGILEVDFIDDPHGDNDLIGTSRKELNLDHEITRPLIDYLKNLLNQVQKEWREKRGKERERKLSDAGVNMDQWLSTFPEKINDKKEIIEKLYAMIAENDLSDIAVEIMKKINLLVPKNPLSHWRFFNKKIIDSKAFKKLYNSKNYHAAFFETIKIYFDELESIVQKNLNNKDKISFKEVDLVNKYLGLDQDIIKLTERDGKDVNYKNIEEGQKDLSHGLLKYRNISAHNNTDKIETKYLFNDQNCLDILSLVSFLLDQLDKRPQKNQMK